MDNLLHMNKPRLYIALYQLGGALGGTFQASPLKYHWALIISPKGDSPSATGKRWLMRQSLTDETYPQPQWRVEKADVPLVPHHDIYLRVLIGKVKDLGKTTEIIESLDGEASDPQASYETWIRAVVTALNKDGKCCKYVPSWDQVEIACEQFMKKKIDEGRFDEQREDSKWNRNRIPTLSMVQKNPNRKNERMDYEIIP